MSDKKAKIFVVYHNPSEAIKDEVYQPICVGPNKDQFYSDFLRDDIGENIAEKNAIYNEMTAIYWVFRHVDEFSDVDFFGFCHYRRWLCFDGWNKTAYVKKKIDEKLIKTDNQKLSQMFKDYGLIVPYPNHYSSVAKHYKKSHNDVDVDMVLEIIKKNNSKYYKTAVDYFANQQEYSYNMFIFKKDDFIEYGNFIFGVLDKFVKEKKDADRLYISERLTGIFIKYLIDQGKEPLKLPVLHIRVKSFKESKKQTRENLKNKKDHGLFYRLKSLILYLMPRWLEQWFRRLKAK